MKPLHYSLRRTLRNRALIHKRLQRRLILFPLVSVSIFLFVIVDTISDGINPLWILVGGLLGLGIGYAVGQIYKIYWREDTQKIVSGIDRITVLLIIVYVLFRFVSEQIAGEFIHGEELTVVTFSFLGGLLMGRMFGVLRKVNRVLQSHPVREHIKNMPPKMPRNRRAKR